MRLRVDDGLADGLFAKPKCATCWRRSTRQTLHAVSVASFQGWRGSTDDGLLCTCWASSYQHRRLFRLSIFRAHRNNGDACTTPEEDTGAKTETAAPLGHTNTHSRPRHCILELAETTQLTFRGQCRRVVGHKVRGHPPPASHKGADSHKHRTPVSTDQQRAFLRVILVDGTQNTTKAVHGKVAQLIGLYAVYEVVLVGGRSWI